MLLVFPWMNEVKKFETFMKKHILCFIKEFSFICVIVLQRTAGESCNNNSSFKIHVIKNLISWNFLRNGLNSVLFNYQHILYITLCNFINFHFIALCQKMLTSISQNISHPGCLHMLNAAYTVLLCFYLMISN